MDTIIDKESARDKSWQGKAGIRFFCQRSQPRRWIVMIPENRSADTWLRLIHLGADFSEVMGNFSLQQNMKNAKLKKKANKKMTRKKIVAIISKPLPKVRKVSCSSSAATINYSSILGLESVCFSVTSRSYSNW